MTHLSFSDRKSAEAFFNSLSNSKIPGINDGGAAVELSWVAGSAAPLPGSTTSSVNLTGAGGGNGLDSAMADADGGGDENHQGGGEDGSKAGHGGPGGEEAGAQGQSQAQQQESGEAKAEVDYDVAGENEWDE